MKRKREREGAKEREESATAAAHEEVSFRGA